MKISSAEFIKGIVGPDKALEDGRPQFAIVGRSNVGKSSVINSLTSQKGLARTSATPGRTQQINLFLINGSSYLVDLPGYGYAKVPTEVKETITELINWYIFMSGYHQEKVFIIIDAEIGPTRDDMDMLRALEEHRKEIVVIANKIDKMKRSEYEKQSKKNAALIGGHRIISYSAKKGIGVDELSAELYG
jgi:GTP-binding protein